MINRRYIPRIVAAIVLFACILLVSVYAITSAGNAPAKQDAPKEQKALRILDAGPTCLDPQCAPDGDTYAQNVFDRLMVTRAADGETEVEPSLAESVEVSPDGLVYTFRLREGVTFANGSSLTSGDVRYSFERLARHTTSENRHLIAGISGFGDYAQGGSEALAGFEIIDDLTFTITLDQPRPAFLAALSATGASILDAETTQAKEGDELEIGDASGTGPYVLDSWEHGASFTLAANPACWSGAPAYAEVHVEPPTDAMPYRAMFQEGELDILDISHLGLDAEYFAHGDLYRKNLMRTLRADMVCIVFNEQSALVADQRVREALRAAIDRKTLLRAVVGGRGALENGILPNALTCGRSGLPDIAYDPERARGLLASAGVGGRLELKIACPASARAEDRMLLELLVSMWSSIGVHASIVEAPSGAADCCIVTPLASYDDPESIFAELAARSEALGVKTPLPARLNEGDRSSADYETRLGAYRELEASLVESGVVVPLFSQSEVLVVADGVEGLALMWNGATGVDLRSVKPAQVRD